MIRHRNGNKAAPPALFFHQSSIKVHQTITSFRQSMPPKRRQASAARVRGQAYMQPSPLFAPPPAQRIPQAG